MAAKKKVVPATASTKLPKGIAVYNGRYYFNLYIGSFETVEETVAIRERALEFKASLKDVAPKAVAAAEREPAPAAEPAPIEPAPVAPPTKKKDKFTWEADDIIVPTVKKKKSKAPPAATA